MAAVLRRKSRIVRAIERPGLFAPAKLDQDTAKKASQKSEFPPARAKMIEAPRADPAGSGRKPRQRARAVIGDQ
jgi:hypothetical protein